VPRRPIRLTLEEGQILSELFDDLLPPQRALLPEESRALAALRQAVMKELRPPVDKSGGKGR
jgi:hypothetical protein